MLINDYISAAEGGSCRSMPLFWWQGYSSRWYVTSVFDLKRFHCPEGGVFILVRREADGVRTPLVVGLSENVSDDIYVTHGDMLMRAIKAGANEIHVHLATADPLLQEDVLHDIAAAWQMPTEATTVAA